MMEVWSLYYYRKLYNMQYLNLFKKSCIKKFHCKYEYYYLFCTEMKILL